MKAVEDNRVQAQVTTSLTKAVADRTNGQLVGAFGERAVEAELLRRGWMTANINASIRNVKDFDLFAVKKNARSLHIRVKTCSPKKDVQYRMREGQEITTDDIGHTDFTVVVRMGSRRDEDRFYVVPTKVVFEALAEWRRTALARQQDKGHWVLRWHELRSGESRPNYGFEKKWQKYLDGWSQLECTAEIDPPVPVRGKR